MRTITRTVISGAADESQLGGVITASYLSQASATISVVDGTGIAGTVKWRQSNDAGATWSDIPGASVAIAGNGTYTLGPTNFSCDVLQAVYVHTAGTGGIITANAHATGPSASDGFAPAGDLSGDELTQVVIGLQGRAVSSSAPSGGQVLKWDATAGAWSPGTDAGFAAGGDLTGSATSQTVIGIQGNAVSATAPNDGQVLKWDAATSKWVPGTDANFSAAGDLSGSASSQTVVGLQSTPVANTAPSSGQVLKYNGTAWAPGTDNNFSAGGDLSGSASSQTVTGIQGRQVVSTAPADGYVYKWSDAFNVWIPAPDSGFSAGGDLSGNATSQTVIRIQGTDVANTAPSSGQVLKYDGAKWAPGTDSSFTAGGDLSGSSSSQTVVKLRGTDVANTAPSSGQVLKFDGSAWTPGADASFTAGGDLSGTSTSQTVAKIQGRDVSNTAPSSGQMLAWDGSAWKPTDAGGSPVLTLATGETTSETTSQVIGQITAATGIVKSLSSVVLSVTGYVAVSGADLVVELYDLTSSTSLKTVTVSSTSPSTVSSAAFSLTSGHVLELRFRRNGGSGNVFAGFVGIQ